MRNKNEWANEYTFTLDNLKKLFNGKISHIRIPNFSTGKECAQLSQEIKKMGFDFYQDFDPPVGKLGVTQYDGIMKGKDAYFGFVETSLQRQTELFLRSFDPLKRLFDYLSTLSSFDLVIPDEPEHGKYFAGVIREINQSVRTHADFAVYDAPDWVISKISHQLTWNLYCELPKYGGECIIYNTLWKIEDDKIIDCKTYEYNLDVLANCAAKVIKPKMGDLYLFNSRNFHEVTMSSSSRISISSFIGKKNNNQLLFWS